MGEWDSAAAEPLEQVTSRLVEAGVIEIFVEQARRSWKANLERYEPSELGDDPQVLGFTSSRNLSNRVARCLATVDEKVQVSWPDGSLLVEVEGIRLHNMKAPSNSRQPAWHSFTWNESDGKTRHRVARANTDGYTPTNSDQDDRQYPLMTPPRP